MHARQAVFASRCELGLGAGCGVDDDPPPAPPLYEGLVFDGPMTGHSPGMPWHYDLHAWLWARNPAGLFTPFNPALSCE